MPHESPNTDDASQTDLSPLEQEVLSQYRSLAIKLKKLSDEIKRINQWDPEYISNNIEGQAYALLQNMRGLERKLGLVYTHFRTAVYSYVMSKGIAGNSANNSTDNSIENASSDRKRSFDTANTHDIGMNEGYVKQLVSEDEGTIFSNIS